jgi:hypothetical protein
MYMNKKLHMFKTFTIFLIFFCSSILILCPTGKSGPLDPVYINTPFIEIEYDRSISEQSVIPYDEPREIPIIIKAKITGATADIIEEYIKDAYLVVDLSIENVPDGCYASINPPFVRFLEVTSSEYKIANATLSFTIDQFVPAFSSKTVKLNASVSEDWKLKGRQGGLLVESASFYFDIPFIVGYQPQLSFSYPEKNVKNIGPGETAVFPIEIENWGNAQSNIKLEVEDIPKGWNASIIDSLTLAKTSLFGDFGDEARGTVLLNVKPPIDFGYREDRTIITVKLTPTTRYENLYFEGEPHYLYFIVQSKGVSTALPAGSEMIIFVFAFIFVIFLIWKGKNYKKQFRGEKK